ncbi:MAG: hypothetical protein KAT70_05295, partial [Thermoplasmata archaeon]|nr:hypothetical protein [Thermoplasmata archaeon]
MSWAGVMNITGSIWLNFTSDPDVVSVEYWYITGGWNLIGPGVFDGTNWTILWDTTGLDHYPTTIYVNVTDDAGLMSMATAMNREIDNTAPTPSLLTPQDDGFIGGMYNITLEEEDAEVIELSWYNGTAWNTLGNMNPVGNGTWWYLWNTDLAIPSNAVNVTIVANATDNVGLKGNDTVLNVTLDNLPPTILVTNLSTWDNITGLYELAYTYSPDVVEVYFEWANHTALPQIYQLVGAEAPDGTFTWDTPLLGDIYVDLKCSARDAAGNTGNYVLENVGVDNIAPTPAFIAPLSEENITGIYNITIQSQNDTTNISLEYYHSSLPGWNHIGYATYNNTTAQWHYEWDTTGLDLYHLTIRANTTDDALLHGLGTVIVTVDNSKPSNGLPTVDDGTNSFTVTGPDGWLRAEPVEVTVIITEDGSGLDTVTLYYTTNGSMPDLSSPSITMDPIPGPFKRYNCTIPPAPHLSTVKFFIYSVDNVNLTSFISLRQYHVDGEAPVITLPTPAVNETSPYICQMENGTGRYIFYSSLMGGPEWFELNGSAEDVGSGLWHANISTAFGDVHPDVNAPDPNATWDWAWLYDIEATDNGN